MLFEDNACSKSIHLDNIKYDKDSLTVQVKDWKFFLVSEWRSYVMEHDKDIPCMDSPDDLHAIEDPNDQGADISSKGI